MAMVFRCSASLDMATVLIPGYYFRRPRIGARLPPVEGSVTKLGLAIYRFGAAIFYANVGRFTEEIRNIVGSRSKVRWLVVDAEAITNLDYTAARMIRELHSELSRKGVVLAFARADHSLDVDLVRHRLIDVIGEKFIFPRLHDAQAAFSAYNLRLDSQLGVRHE